MTDFTTGRFCIVCSYCLHDHWQNDTHAIVGLPHLCDLDGKPITDQLCRWHLAHFLKMATYISAMQDDGTPATYKNGVLQYVRKGERTRPDHATSEVASRDDLSLLLEWMERRLYLLNAQVRLGLLWDDVSEQTTVSLDEVIERAKLHRAIERFLKSERGDDPDGPIIPAFYANTPIDDPDDRISGEE